MITANLELIELRRNLVYSSQEFWFGTEPVASDKLTQYLKSEKTTDVAHHVAAWASETGKGLLFYGKESGNPAGVIQLVRHTKIPCAHFC